MSNAQFPSGPWTGFYLYHGAPHRHRMDLSLTFSSGKVDGHGVDDIGPFTIAGSYDEAAATCGWAKRYLGAHSVSYRGFREGKGIWGTWEIAPDGRGGFHIWPLGQAPAEHARQEAEAPVPAGVQSSG